jgi:hypothetical protein
MDRQKREFATRQMQERAREKETSCNKYAAGGALKLEKTLLQKAEQRSSPEIWGGAVNDLH